MRVPSKSNKGFKMSFLTFITNSITEKNEKVENQLCHKKESFCVLGLTFCRAARLLVKEKLFTSAVLPCDFLFLIVCVVVVGLLCSSGLSLSFSFSYSLLPAITFVNFKIPSVLVVVSAVIAEAIVSDTCKSFVFVAVPTSEG